MTSPPTGDPTSDDEDVEADDVIEIDGDVEPPEPPPPYEFDPGDVEPAARRFDAAYAAAALTSHWSAVIDGIRGGPPTAETLESQTSLDRALQTPVLFDLRLALAREVPGCRLGPQINTETYAYPARVREVPEPEVRLWRELAGRVEHPAARARLHDLLVERRDGNGRAHAEAAVDAYLELAGGAWDDDGGVPFAVAELLVRAWELCRRYQLWDRHQRVQATLLVAAARELATKAHTPGIVLPMLEAAAAPPVRRQPADATDAPPDTPISTRSSKTRSPPTQMTTCSRRRWTWRGGVPPPTTRAPASLPGRASC